MNYGDLIFSLEDNRLDSGVEWSGYAAEALEQEMANFFDPQPDLAFNTTGVKPDMFTFNEPVDVTVLEVPEFSAARIGNPMFGKVGGTGLGIGGDDGSEIQQLGTPVGYSHRRSARKIQQATDSLFGNAPPTFQFDPPTISLPQLSLRSSSDQIAALNLNTGSHLGTPGLSTGPLSPRSTFAGITPVFETFVDHMEEVEAGALFGPGNDFNGLCLPVKSSQDSTSITPLLDQFAFVDQAIPRPVTPIEQIAPSFDSLNVPSSVHSHCSHGGYQSSHHSPAHTHLSYPTSPFDSCISPSRGSFTIPPSSSALSPYDILDFDMAPSTPSRTIPANFEFTYSLDMPTPTRANHFAVQSSTGLFKRAEQNLPFIPYVPAPAVAKGRKKRSHVDMEVDSDDIQVPKHGRYPSELSVAGPRKPSAARSKSSPRRVSSASSTKSLGRPSKESQLQEQNFDVSMIPNLHTKPAEYFQLRPWLLENRIPNIDEWRASERYYKGYDVPITDVDLFMSKGNPNNPAEDTSKWYCRVVDDDGVACGTVTARKTGCRDHIKNHHLEVVPFKCMWPLCDRSSVRKHDIERHCNYKHYKLETFPCLECGKVCGRKDALKRHVSKAHPQTAAAMEAAAPSKKRTKRGE